jgi:hypothetical protein
MNQASWAALAMARGGIPVGCRGPVHGPRCEMQPMIASDATAQRAPPCRLDHPQLQPAGRAVRLCREPAARHRRLCQHPAARRAGGRPERGHPLFARDLVLRGAYGASLRQLPFLPYLALRSLLYLGIILLVLIASNLRVGVTRADIAFSLAMSLGFNLLLGVNDLLGPGVLFRFLEKARLTTIP